MSQKEYLIKRLKSTPKDFELRELEKLFGLCGCMKSNAGKTSGSAVKYIYASGKKKRIFSLHKPHPGNVLKKYVLEGAIAFLTDIGEI